MNRALVISAILLVAVVMGMSAVAPMIPEAFAHNTNVQAHLICGKLGFQDNIPPNVFEFLCGHLTP